MAWWDNNLMLEYVFSKEKKPGKGRGLFFWAYRTLRSYLAEHFIELLYVFSSFVTYAYLAAVVAIFFLKDAIPPIMIKIIDSVSEPYLGLIGIYIILKEIRERKGDRVSAYSEIFVALWFSLLIVSTLFTFFSQQYHFDEFYKLIITDSLAAFIIRLGTFLHRFIL
jgi:amino acid transporter